MPVTSKDGQLSGVLAASLTVGVVTAALLVGKQASPGPDHPRTRRWYKRLDKPDYTPPAPVFPIAWSTIQACHAHAEHGSNPGWLVTSRADLLLRYFLDSDDLVTVPFLRLKRWAFGSGPQGGVYAWPENPQRRYGQPNDTWGRCVPVSFLENNVGARRTKVRQAALPLMMNGRSREMVAAR